MNFVDHMSRNATLSLGFTIESVNLKDNSTLEIESKLSTLHKGTLAILKPLNKDLNSSCELASPRGRAKRNGKDFKMVEMKHRVSQRVKEHDEE
jgi:hypothetical protein